MYRLVSNKAPLPRPRPDTEVESDTIEEEQSSLLPLPMFDGFKSDPSGFGLRSGLTLSLSMAGPFRSGSQSSWSTSEAKLLSE